MNVIKRLVIGATGIKGVTDCVDWDGQIPLLSNYHQIYFYMPSLDLPKLKKVISKNSTTLRDMQTQLFEVLKSPLFSVYCITASKVRFGGVCSYDFLPFDLIRVDGDVKTFEDKEFSNKYMSSINESDGYFEYNVGQQYLNSHLTSNESLRFTWNMVSIFKTLHGKLVAFTVDLKASEKVYEYGEYKWKYINTFGTSMLFVPKAFESAQSNITALLNKSESDTTEIINIPEWLSEITLSGESEVIETLNNNISKKTEIENLIINNNKQIKQYDKFKSILFLKGEPLEKAIDYAFDFLGITLQKGIQGQEDRWLVSDSNKIPIEIKGHKGSVKTDDVRQIIERTRLAKNSIGKTQGLLIANPYCETNPKNRLESFTKTADSILDKSSSFDVGLLDTITLLKYVEEKLETGKFDIDKFEKTLFTTVGIVKQGL